MAIVLTETIGVVFLLQNKSICTLDLLQTILYIKRSVSSKVVFMMQLKL